MITAQLSRWATIYVNVCRSVHMRTRIRSPRRQKAIIQPLDPSHPQGWDNPDNEEVWLELARAIGRQIARDENDGLEQPKGGRA
ncbi:hypothetical protein GCM10007858_01890 [Bradyrhizobium liaoningense]|nr:hypothetical protein GCM10007858_01890 [Bradyrhizobium liaoningense]